MPLSKTDRSWAAEQWLWRTISMTAVILLGSCFANYRVNYYGLYGNAAGKRYSATGNEDRTTKYLYAMNYIPANFDGLLVGSSISGTWDTHRITAARIYNGSLWGGNITEARAVADNVLDRRKLRVVLFVEFPFLTGSSGFRNGRMEPGLKWASLGSLTLLASYGELAASRLGFEYPETNAWGAVKFPDGSVSDPTWQSGQHMTYDFHFPIDPVARQEYAALAGRARAGGARIVRVRPLIYSQFLREDSERFRDYFRQMETLFEKSDGLIDFTDPSYAWLQSDRANFTDGVHVTWEVAGRLMDDVDQKLRVMLQTKR